MKNIFYFYNINSIGGVESMFYYLAKKYKNKDITVYYSSGDSNQIKRLKEFIEVKQYKGEKIKCEKAFFNYNTSIIDNIDAKEYYLIVHADYIDLGIKPLTHPKITKYIRVSQKACDSYSKLTGLPCELCYNPIDIDKPRNKKLRFISATRLTKEKGKNRIIKLGNKLNELNINYEWTIFTNDINAINNPNIIYKQPTLDIIDYINDADYLVQLSDNEGYCYSVVEALCCGTPVIVTPCPVFEEIGLKDKENCYYIDFDMKNIPIDDIVNNIPKFTYTPKEDNWEKLLAPGESEYQKNLHTSYEVEATDLYKLKKTKDAELNRIPKETEKWYTNKLRAEMLASKGYVKLTGNQKFDE